MANTKEIKKTRRSAESLKVDLRNIVIEDSFNCRKDYGDLTELMNSIIELGQLEPVKGYKVKGEDKFILTDGHRRFKAIQMAHEQGHPIDTVFLMKSSSTKEDRDFEMLVTGLGKKLLEPIEQAEAFKRLLSYGFNKSEIAKKIGKSHTYIAQMLRVADAPKEVKNLVESGEVAINTVSKLMKDNNSEQVKEIIKENLKEKRDSGDKKKLTFRDIKKTRTPELSIMQRLLEAQKIIEQNDEHFDSPIGNFFINLVDSLERKTMSTQDIVDFVQNEQ